MKKRIEAVTVYGIDMGEEHLPRRRPRQYRQAYVAQQVPPRSIARPLGEHACCTYRDGELSRIPVVGTEAPGLGPHGQDHPGTVREALREVQQERHGRRCGDRRGSNPAYDAIHSDQATGAECSPGASPRARRYMSQRTGLINQMRGFLLEFGIAIRQGAGVFRLDVPRVLGDEENELPPSMRTLLSDLWNDFKLLEIRIEELSKQIQRSVQYSDTARRLMTVPGIGPLAASALEASAGNGHQFVNGRFFAAWLGLTPREYSTGGKTTDFGMLKWPSMAV